MRYIPSTDHAANIDDIAAQCRAAIATDQPATPERPRWGEMAKDCHQRQARWGAGHECSGSRQLAEDCQSWHDADVAEAFGDYRQASRIRRETASLA